METVTMLSGITITCFFASYLVAFVLDVTRLFWRVPVRLVIMLGFAAAGLLAHTIYLGQRVQNELASGVAPLSTWHDWIIMAAWIVAAAYLGLALRRPQNAVGIFVLPLVFLLLGIGFVYKDAETFSRVETIDTLQVVHGVLLLLGTVSVSLGFAACLMYLAQSYRLKHKMPPRQGFRLPPLEWLQRFTRRSLIISTGLLAGGLGAGVLLNLSREDAGLPWYDSGVLFSSVLFLWLLAAMLVEFFYRPAREGRKVALITLASFVFLAVALVSVLLTDHGAAASRAGEPPAEQTVQRHSGGLR